MAKIRDDLDGVVTIHVNGVPQSLRAGDPVPRGITVADSLLASYDEDADAPSPAPDPLSEDELAAAREVGVDVDDEHPEYVRGYLDGVRSVDVDAAVSQGLEGLSDGDGNTDEGPKQDEGVTVHGSPVGTDYDPGEAPNVQAVLDYLEAHPAERDAVIQRERDGKARVGILESEYATPTS